MDQVRERADLCLVMNHALKTKLGFGFEVGRGRAEEPLLCCLKEAQMYAKRKACKQALRNYDGVCGEWLEVYWSGDGGNLNGKADDLLNENWIHLPSSLWAQQQ